MRSLLLLVSIVGLQAPSIFDTPDAEILRLGRARWEAKVAASPAGGSTAGMVGAQGRFSEALARENDRLLKGRSAALRAFVPRYRKIAREATNEAITIGRGITGGGTMWNIVAASSGADIEEVVAGMIRPSKRLQRKGLSAADAQKSLDRLGRRVLKEASSIERYRSMSGIGAEEAKVALGRLRVNMRSIERLPMAEADRRLTREFVLRVLADVR